MLMNGNPAQQPKQKEQREFLLGGLRPFWRLGALSNAVSIRAVQGVEAPKGVLYDVKDCGPTGPGAL